MPRRRTTTRRRRKTRTRSRRRPGRPRKRTASRRRKRTTTRRRKRTTTRRRKRTTTRRRRRTRTRRRRRAPSRRTRTVYDIYVPTPVQSMMAQIRGEPYGAPTLVRTNPCTGKKKYSCLESQKARVCRWKNGRCLRY